MPNKRRHSRADAGFQAEIVMGGITSIVTTRNLSMKGLLATGNLSLVEGKTCEVRIPLAPGLRIVVEGRIVRADKEATAVDFMGMDEESFTILHRVMQLNAEDADVIDEELTHPYFSE